MESESFFFKGAFLMKYLSDELDRARNEMEKLNELGNEGAGDLIFLKYCIKPLVLHENRAVKNITTGYRVADPMYLTKPVSGEEDVVKCRVIEHKIPFDGDKRLFEFTTRPYPFYPFGRLEDGMFVITEKEGEDLYISNYRYNLVLLKDCLKISTEAVKCYNSHIKEMIDEVSCEFIPRCL